MLIFIRLLPLLVGALNTLLFFLQARNPGSYPWLAIIAPVALAGASIAVLWRRRRGSDDVRLMIPSFLALLVAGYGLLLAEHALALWIIPLVAGGISFVSLELLFLSTFVSARYPVNGLSHLNLTIVPLVLWLTAFTSVGLTVFLNMSRLVPLSAMTVVMFLLFYATSHAEAGRSARWRWAWLGAWLGVHVGILCAVLPVNLAMHGVIAALIGSFAIRVRRYGMMPPIPRRLILVESMMALIMLVAVCVTAQWV